MSLKQKHNTLRIIIAGGGTGGHIFPAIAVAQAIKALAPDAVILFVGALGKWKWKKYPKQDSRFKALPLQALIGLSCSKILHFLGSF